MLRTVALTRQDAEDFIYYENRLLDEWRLEEWNALFTAEGGRYYIRGKADSPCFVYVEDPKVSFKDDRIVIHVKTHAKLGTALHGACLGVSTSGSAPAASSSSLPP